MRQLQKKIKNGTLNIKQDDPFELFVAATNIRYCYYNETHKILGNTFGMCVLQVGDFPQPATGGRAPRGCLGCLVTRENRCTERREDSHVFPFTQTLSVEDLATFPRNLIIHRHKKNIFYLKQHLSRDSQTGSDAPSHLGLTSLIEHGTLHDPRTPDLVRTN